ncbi:MAG: ABC transporter ATP-binding protein [Chitinophagales bacterium]|nr:ABC transporter ATP-binding protein [Chitinophagales bacterium]
MKELAFLNKYFSKYKWRILAGVFFVICANLLNVINPLITRSAVDLIAAHLADVTTTEEAVVTLQNNIGWQVFFLFLKYLAVALMAGAFTFFMRQTIIVVSRLIEYDMKAEIYDHYQQLDLAFYRKNNTGDLMNRITEDVSRVRMYVGPAIMYAVNLLFTILFSVISMLLINPELTLWVLVPLPVLSFVIYYVNELVEKASTAIQAKLSDLTTDAQETYSGIRMVQAYNREKEMLRHFEEEAEAYKQKQLRLARVDSVYFPAMTFLVGCSIILVVYVGGLQVGMNKLSAGSLAAFIMYTNMLMWPVSALGWTASMVQRAIASQRRINEFLKQQPMVKGADGIEKNIEGDIRFEHVSFTYPDTGIQALTDVSFHVKPGERIAIIGKTGSGKSTIADLLMRMYDATSGQIKIDGVEIHDYKLGSLRRQIGFVPQDVFLFSETITENIGFGVEGIDQATATRYARYASISNEIERFPEGYNTMVGERGVTLSGGQKQRISIARALVKQPNVLVLDDSLSAVDTATEKQIQQNLDEILYGKTAIIITHRIFSLIHFSNIIVLDAGKIVEQGTHEELLKKQGLYADIYRRQQQESRVEAKDGIMNKS